MHTLCFIPWVVPFMVLVMSHQRVHCLRVQLERPAVGHDSWSLFGALLGESPLNPSYGYPGGSNDVPPKGEFLGASLE